MNYKSWFPFILQSIALLGAGWGYATAQEHRLTVMEETIKFQAEATRQIAETQRLMMLQVTDIQRTQERLVALEEFIHRRK